MLLNLTVDSLMKTIIDKYYILKDDKGRHIRLICQNKVRRRKFVGIVSSLGNKKVHSYNWNAVSNIDKIKIKGVL